MVNCLYYLLKGDRHEASNFSLVALSFYGGFKRPDHAVYFVLRLRRRPRAGGALRFLSEKPLLLFMNFLPVFLLFVFLYALSGRLWLGFSVTGLLFFALSVVQQFKLMYRDEPFVLPEILLFRESMMMKGHYHLSVFASNPVTLIGLIAMVFVAVFLFLWDRKPLAGKGRRRLLFLSTAAIVFVFQGFSGPYFSPKVYARVGEKAPINTLNATENYMARGLVYPFVMSGRMFSGNKPENYDKSSPPCCGRR